MSTNSRFNNPYKGCEKTARLIVDVDENDYMLIKTIRVTSGTITGTVGTLYQKLCNELRKRGITDYTKTAEFESFIANCVISDGPTIGGAAAEGLPDRTPSRPVAETVGVDDDGRTAPVGGQPTPVAHVVPVVQSGANPGQGTKRARKGTKKG